jgi:hypothetical protein
VSEEARYHLARYLALYRMDVVKAALQAGVGEAQARALLDDPSLMKVVAYNRWVLDQPHEVRQRWLHELALRKLGRTAEADALPGPRSPLCPPTDSSH